MRYIVYGAGAIGGTVGACLHMSGNDVTLIARGAHGRAIASSGLRYETPREKVVLQIPVVEHPQAVQFREDDVVLLATKVQDSVSALRALADVADFDIPVFCLQNGVEGERLALRLFANVYGGLVLAPGEHLEPGLVLNRSHPDAGVIDLGRYPSGVDELCRSVATAFNHAGLVSEVREQIMRWKYAKLLGNLANAIQAVFDASVTFAQVSGPATQILGLLTSEAEAVFRAANIDAVSSEEFWARMHHVNLAPIEGRDGRQVGSTWQSLSRGSGRVESDYLNGEIVLLGRLHGVPTPANALLSLLSNQLAARHQTPGSITEEQFLARLGVAA